MTNYTAFGCDFDSAELFSGVKTFKQGSIMIFYSGLVSCLLMFFIVQNVLMCKNKIPSKIKFLYLTNCIFIIYLIIKIYYLLKEIAYCVGYMYGMFLFQLNFFCSFLSYNFFNLAICEVLIRECPRNFERALIQLYKYRRITLFCLFPLILFQSIIYWFDVYSGSMLIIYSDILLRTLEYVIQIYIFYCFYKVYRFLYNKNELLRFISPKSRFICYFWIILFSFGIRCIWYSIIYVQQYILSQVPWIYLISDECFENGKLLGVLIEVFRMIISEFLSDVGVLLYLFPSSISKPESIRLELSLL